MKPANEINYRESILGLQVAAYRAAATWLYNFGQTKLTEAYEIWIFHVVSKLPTEFLTDFLLLKTT